MNDYLNFSPVHRRRFGLTLIELLVVVTIIAVMIGLLLPAIQKIREAAARISSRNKLKQITLAAHGYHNQMGYFPSVAHNPNSLFHCLLPHIEQGNMFKQEEVDELTAGRQYLIPTFINRADPSIGSKGGKFGGNVSYASNYQAFGESPRPGAHARGRRKLSRSFRDGTTHTVAFTEKYAEQQLGSTHW